MYGKKCACCRVTFVLKLVKLFMKQQEESTTLNVKEMSRINRLLFIMCQIQSSQLCRNLSENVKNLSYAIYVRVCKCFFWFLKQKMVTLVFSIITDFTYHGFDYPWPIFALFSLVMLTFNWAVSKSLSYLWFRYSLNKHLYYILYI